MRIAIISQYVSPHIGGLEQVVADQIHGMTACGHAITLITCAVVGAPAGVTCESAATVVRVPGNNTLDTRFGIPFCLLTIDACRQVFRAVANAEVVHVHDVFYPISWCAYVAARWYRKPIVLTQHVGMVDHPSKLVTFVQRIVYAVWGDRLFRASVAIVTYNSIVREFLRVRGVSMHKVHTYRNGVDVSLFHPTDADERASIRRRFSLPVDKPLALFVGRFVPKKGYLDVFAARDPAYDLVFVGTGSVPDAWHTTPGVHVLGALDHSTLPALYRAVDVCVSPTRGELFTIVMQEAWASGTPVVTTDEPGYRAFDIDRSLVSFCDPSGPALRREIARILHDRELLARMRTYAVELAHRWFDRDTNMADMCRLYERIAQVVSKPVVTTSWDDGHVLDVRLAKLLRAYGIAGTFYVAPDNHELTVEQRLSTDTVRTLAADFEIGAHTTTHRPLTSLSHTEAEQEIRSSRETLERMIGRSVTSFCYPRGEYAPTHVRMVADAGYTYARTVCRFSTALPSDALQSATTTHTYDHWSDLWRVLVLARFSPVLFLRLYRSWDQQAIHLFDRIVVHGGVFHLWGHSAEIERNHDWERLERVLRHIAGRANVRYVPNSALSFAVPNSTSVTQ